jgi:Surface-adhesin protein E
MRSTHAILSGFFLLSSGAAADWTPVGGDNDIYAAFADQASIRPRGDNVSMSGMYDFRKRDFTPEGKALFSTVVLREYDCRGRRVRLLSAIDFSGHTGEGEAVSASADPGRWEPVIEGALDEAYWKVACARK